MSDIDLSALPDDVRKHLEAVEAERDAAVTAHADATAELAELRTEAEKEQELVKAAPGEVQALIAKLQADQAEARAALAAEVTKRQDTMFVAKAKDEMGHVFADANVAGPALRELANAAPEAWAKIEPELVAASQRIENGDLFAEFGGTGAAADAVAKRDAFVAKHIEANPDATAAQARVAFYKAHPEAVAELRGE